MRDARPAEVDDVGSADGRAGLETAPRVARHGMSFAVVEREVRQPRWKSNAPSANDASSCARDCRRPIAPI
jgi:hypothetical protein